MCTAPMKQRGIQPSDAAGDLRVYRFKTRNKEVTVLVHGADAVTQYSTDRRSKGIVPRGIEPLFRD